MRYLLKNAKFFSQGVFHLADVFLSDGKIVSIGDGVSPSNDTIVIDISIIEASNPVPTPLLGHRCRSSQEITGSPTPFSTSNHYLWICESASFSLSNPNIAA